MCIFKLPRPLSSTADLDRHIQVPIHSYCTEYMVQCTYVHAYCTLATQVADEPWPRCTSPCKCESSEADSSLFISALVPEIDNANHFLSSSTPLETPEIIDKVQTEALIRIC